MLAIAILMRFGLLALIGGLCLGLVVTGVASVTLCVVCIVWSAGEMWRLR